MDFLNLFKKPEQAHELATPPKKKVLLAEDEVYIRDVYQELLTDEGFEVMPVSNGQDALALVEQNNFDVIFLDVMMPVLDGLQTLEALKKNEKTKHIPVVVLTNAGNIENIETAKYHKVFRFLIKSNIIPDEVVKTAKDAMSASTTTTSL